MVKIGDKDEKVVFCKNCTMSNQRPRIQFNEKGFCSACVFNEYKNNHVDWDKREKELSDICDKFRKEDGSWDVVVPSSGGKDSSYVSYMLKKKFGMHPLTVTMASALPTEIGQENLFDMAFSGQDNVSFTPNGVIHRKLSKASLIEFGDNFIPFNYGQINVPLQCAIKFNIPFVIFGENGELEYGGTIQDYNRPTLRISTIPSGKFLGLRTPGAASRLPDENWLPDGIKVEDIQFYLPPTQEELDRVGVTTYFYNYFENWNPEDHIDVAKKFCGYKENHIRSEGTYTNFASLDDKTDGFHYYMMFIKMGIGRATSDSAHQVRHGLITRDEGVELVQKYDGEFPKKYLDEFLEYIDINTDELNNIFDKFRRSLIWKKENKEWKLRHQITKL